MAYVTPGGRGMGWRRSPADTRDYIYVPEAVAVPASVDLSSQMLAIRDQGQLGSCTAFAATAMAYHTYVRDGWHNSFPPSPLFVYYNERDLEGTVDEDSGGTGRLVVQSLAKFGITNEKNWPYILDEFTTKPPAAVYTNAAKHEATSYMSVIQDAAHMELCLAAGYTFIVGIDVYESFESDAVAATGKVPMPDINTEQFLGGHMLCACGYDSIARLIKCQNSWGVSFGDKGYVYLPYEYLIDTNLGGDYWTLRVQR